MALLTVVLQKGDELKPVELESFLILAFGAGALLSAVNIDLFSPAINQGLFFEVAIGALIGSVFYLLLNHQLNQKGGSIIGLVTRIGLYVPYYLRFLT